MDMWVNEESEYGWIFGCHAYGSELKVLEDDNKADEAPPAHPAVIQYKISIHTHVPISMQKVKWPGATITQKS